MMQTVKNIFIEFGRKLAPIILKAGVERLSRWALKNDFETLAKIIDELRRRQEAHVELTRNYDKLLAKIYRKLVNQRSHRRITHDQYNKVKQMFYEDNFLMANYPFPLVCYSEDEIAIADGVPTVDSAPYLWLILYLEVGIIK